MGFPVIKPSLFVARQTTIHVAANPCGFVAVERPMQQQREGFAYLRHGDGWRPFFFPAAFR